MKDQPFSAIRQRFYSQLLFVHANGLRYLQPVVTKCRREEFNLARRYGDAVGKKLRIFPWRKSPWQSVNLLTPNDHYSGRTAPLVSKRCILYIYSTNTGTEYFKHGIYSPFLSLQNAVCFIILTYLVPVLFTFYIQGVLKFKKIIPAPKG